jgi:heme oxygenase
MNAPTIATTAPSRPQGLADALRDATQALHTRAERTGLVNDILRGQASREDYAVFLRNLLPVYEALEQGLERRRGLPEIGELAQPSVYRAASLIADLEALHGPGWADEIPILPVGRDYAARLIQIAADDPSRLIPHAYVRYLGDLNGGQVLKRLLARALNLPATMLGFYEFQDIADLQSFRGWYRDAFDAAGTQIADFAPLCEEAQAAFSLNIALSDALKPGGASPAAA